MSTGFGSISQMQVEQNLGLTIGELDTDLNESKTAINATEGSGISATFVANVGDVVSFSYEFGTNDYIPYQDFSFYSINGQAKSRSGWSRHTKLRINKWCSQLHHYK